jgi:hypothetical protein
MPSMRSDWAVRACCRPAIASPAACMESWGTRTRAALTSLEAGDRHEDGQSAGGLVGHRVCGGPPGRWRDGVGADLQGFNPNTSRPSTPTTGRWCRRPGARHPGHSLFVCFAVALARQRDARGRRGRQACGDGGQHIIPQPVKRPCPRLTPAAATPAPIRDHKASPSGIAASPARPARRAPTAVTACAAGKPWGKEMAVPVPRGPVVSAGCRMWRGRPAGAPALPGPGGGRLAACGRPAGNQRECVPSDVSWLVVGSGRGGHGPGHGQIVVVGVLCCGWNALSVEPLMSRAAAWGSRRPLVTSSAAAWARA